MIYLNSDKGVFSRNKKDYLLEADRQMGWGMFKDVQQAEGEIEYLLNIQPCDLKNGTKWTGLWHIDVSLDSHFPQHYANMDTVFVASTVGILPYEKQRILFQACDPVLHRRIESIPQDYDFVICGTGGATDGIYAERGRVYKILMDKFKYFDGQNGHPPEEYVRICNKGKVQVVQPGLGQNGLGMCAQRFFECLGIGPVLADYTPDLEYLGLDEGKDYFSFKTDTELVEKMSLLVNDKALRDKMFENGRKKALELHTYAHRAVTIFNTVNEFISGTS